MDKNIAFQKSDDGRGARLPKSVFYPKTRRPERSKICISLVTYRHPRHEPTDLYCLPLFYYKTTNSPLLGKLEVHWCVRKISPLDPFLRTINPVYWLKSYLFRTHLILPSDLLPGLPRVSSAKVFLPKFCTHFLSLLFPSDLLLLDLITLTSYCKKLLSLKE